MTVSNIISLDLGATKCAGGVIEYQHETRGLICKNTCHVKLADTSSLEELLLNVSEQLGLAFSEANAICIGAAGQYNGVELHHLEGVYPYSMRIADIAKKQQWPHYAVIHDYDTIVCATFTSYTRNKKNVLALNTCTPHPHGRRVALGLGTGLGLKDGVLLSNGDFWLGKNEAGHIGIINPPLANPLRLAQHQEFMHFLRVQQNTTSPQITFENILTGRGLVCLYQFLYPSNETISPEMVGHEIQSGKTPELLDLFAWYLGLFTGSIQLLFMPEGGIWMTGGVAIKNLEIFSQPSFTEGINASPAYTEERRSYPLGVMKNEQHALIGGGYYAVHRLIEPATVLS